MIQRVSHWVMGLVLRIIWGSDWEVVVLLVVATTPVALAGSAEDEEEVSMIV